ncbi:MAG: site-specific integrase [Defluviitaleaceae bacterium]|nr:site-specific integrase [Defluviitaleaceae bacterium]
MPKRNAQGAGSIRQRADGTWEARYTIGRDPGTGKQVRKSVYGKTQKEVRQKLAVATVAIDEGTYIEPSRLTVGAWIDIWLAEYNKSVKALTLKEYTGQCNFRIKPSLGAVKLSALRPHDIQAFLNKQEQPTANAKGLSPKSIKNLHGILHKSLQQAVMLGYIAVNPANAIRLPRVEKAHVKPLDTTQMKAFLTAIKGHHFETLFIFDLFTGLRKSELIGLTWDCLQGDTLYVYRQLQRIDGKYVFRPLKNSKSRRITPAASIMQLLREHKQKQHEQSALFGNSWSNDDGFIFTNEFGRHLIHDTVYENFKRIAVSLNMPSARFHDLRHSYAVSALRAGDDVKTVQENLGHHTAAFTLDTYGHVTEEMKKESAARMDNFIKGIFE